MPRCTVCNEKFEVKRFNQKSCENEDCVYEHFKRERLKKWERESKKANGSTKKAKTKTTQEYLQDEVNKLSRMIDAHFNYKCIDCGKPYGKQTDGAHFHSRGNNKSNAYNLHNLHSARAHCNQYSAEHKPGYRIGLENRYGIEYKEYVEFEIVRLYPVIKLTQIEYKEALKKTRKCIREFDNLIGNYLDGSIARIEFNKLIGIYNK